MADEKPAPQTGVANADLERGSAGWTGEPGEAQPVRDAMDASDSEQLRRNPSNEDAKLEVALDETFPSSDAPSNTQPGKGKDPPPSTGYDPDAEGAIARS